MKALLIIDVQNDFLPGGALAVPGGDAILPVVQEAMDLAERGGWKIVATQDHHPADHRSFASRHPGREVGEVVPLNGLDQVLWPDHCVQGTRGAAFADAIDEQRFDAVFAKGEDPEVDSYSGFFDNGRRHATGLSDWLVDAGVRSLVVLGLATDYCVKATALDAVREGFDVALVPAGCRAVNLAPGDEQAALDEMSTAGIVLRSLDDLREELPAPSGS